MNDYVERKNKKMAGAGDGIVVGTATMVFVLPST